MHACPMSADIASPRGSAVFVVRTTLLEVLVPEHPGLTGSFIISGLHNPASLQVVLWMVAGSSCM